jgi:hypothetical protein
MFVHHQFMHGPARTNASAAPSRPQFGNLLLSSLKVGKWLTYFSWHSMLCPDPPREGLGCL